MSTSADATAAITTSRAIKPKRLGAAAIPGNGVFTSPV